MLVQYVPTGFGLRGANIPWTRWLLERARRHGNDVRVMFHEPYFEFTRRPHASERARRRRARDGDDAAARGVARVPVDRRLAPISGALRAGGRSQDFVTLPVPSTIPTLRSPRRHRRTPPPAPWGVDDTTWSVISARSARRSAPLLEATLIPLLTSDPDVSAVCLGSGTDEFVRALVANAPMIRGRIHGAGRVSRSDAALTLNACDLLLQPYPDGVTTRRTSVMAGLINGRAIVTTDGSSHRACLGGERCCRAGPGVRTSSRSSPPCARCSPKTTTARHSRRAAKRSIASASRSTTRFARCGERSKARPA